VGLAIDSAARTASGERGHRGSDTSRIAIDRPLRVVETGWRSILQAAIEPNAGRVAGWTMRPRGGTEQTPGRSFVPEGEFGDASARAELVAAATFKAGSCSALHLSEIDDALSRFERVYARVDVRGALLVK
jgi:hypothetical protein